MHVIIIWEIIRVDNHSSEFRFDPPVVCDLEICSRAIKLYSIKLIVSIIGSQNLLVTSVEVPNHSLPLRGIDVPISLTDKKAILGNKVSQSNRGFFGIETPRFVHSCQKVVADFSTERGIDS